MIKVQNLTKAFGQKLAVNDLSFSVERGEVLGFLGPNGAGKSTSMRMITGFFPPTSGGISVGGHDMLENPIAAKQLIGYLPENAPAYTDMTVHGFLSFAAEIRGAVRRVIVETNRLNSLLIPQVTDPGDELLTEMMNACLGEIVPPEYLPMVRIDMGFDSGHIEWPTSARPEE